jgi:hypothetical protein
MEKVKKEINESPELLTKDCDKIIRLNKDTGEEMLSVDFCLELLDGIYEINAYFGLDETKASEMDKLITEIIDMLSKQRTPFFHFQLQFKIWIYQ